MFHRRRRVLPAFRGCLEAELGSKPLPISGWDPCSPTLPRAYMATTFLSYLSGTLLLQIAGSSLSLHKGSSVASEFFAARTRGPGMGEAVSCMPCLGLNSGSALNNSGQIPHSETQLSHL